jgi:hypothetical protein
MDLNVASHELGTAPIPTIVHNLDRIFGKDTWQGYELETISLELGYAFDELTRDKINFLQLLTENSTLYFNDVLFFVHGVEIINNNVADFETFPLPSSLELAFAYVEVKKLYPDGVYGSGVLKTVQYILTLEGYSEAVFPFNEMGIKNEDLAPGQLPEDTKNKTEAIRRYIEAMNDPHSRNTR